MNTSAPESGYVRFVSREQTRSFSDPAAIVSAQTIEEVLPALEQVATHVREGCYAAGYVAYEAAPAFDAALVAHAPADLPLVWFGIYTAPPKSDARTAADYSVGTWEPRVNEEDYRLAVQGIREYIAAGDTYQVNYTFPMDAPFEGDAAAWFQELCAAQQADHCAYLQLGAQTILSASPELFFRRDGDRITTRPMKGTCPRGLWPDADAKNVDALKASDKERAENIMIVDMHRNDLGRIAETGTVEVDSLFDVERYRTLWQMTSTVSAETQAKLPDVFAALFPSASVTGAPKVRTMEIIRELEPEPRGVYCGSIGWCGPDGAAEFNVAIRTVTIDHYEGRARYNVGSGITWDSTPEGEYAECVTKTEFLLQPQPHFELLESILYDGNLFLLNEHLARLRASAEYFGIPLNIRNLEAQLNSTVFPAGRRLKVRVLVDQDGTYRITRELSKPSKPVRVAIAQHPVHTSNPFLYHKTTHREVYDKARASRSDCDDVILLNERGEVTESTTANVVVEMEGVMITPPVESGLLAGTFREHLLSERKVVEEVIHHEDLRHAEAVYLINSVRKWIDADLVE